MALTTVDQGLLGTYAQYTGFKNRIINGAMMIDQRNAGASVTPANGDYLLDRYRAIAYQASKFSVQQNAGAVTPPVGFTNYLGVTSLSAYTVGTSETFAIRQTIEGLNVADLGWGTSNASAVTLSFKVYSSLTGTFGGTIFNSAQNRWFVFSYSVPVANTWTTVSITIAGDTSGTWLTNNGAGIGLQFSLGSGATVSGSAGTWGSTAYMSSTGATSVVGTNGATFYITGVQLEKGSTATSFDYRPYGTELSLCQRYFSKSFNTETAPAEGLSDAVYTSGAAYSSTRMYSPFFNYPVPMRAAPTITYYRPALSATNGTWATWVSSVWGATTGVSTNFIGTLGFCVDFQRTTATMTVSSAYLLAGNWTASAEL